ncbi:MAG: hypothetical protein CMJ41_02225 [Phycisphaerae bacterium]|nr:hypothetical protein [Phycisphaerae bacterium]HBZ97234.1 hypothetical protein [Phycisphaerales bacterium]|tara:strand:- start:9 stop:248 length:240 start_codon:yes stop_codon:yes gene_type:complete
MILTGWIPFLEPMNWLQGLWYVLLVPLAFGIAASYKAMRIVDMRNYWRQVGMMTGQIVVVIAALAVGLILFVTFVLPRT